MTVPRVNPVAGDGPRPFWSIVIPTFNPDLGYLRECLQSIVASGLDPAEREILLVDDASEGGTLCSVAEDFRPHGVRLLPSPTRGGQAANWNRALEYARGHWIHLLHQDDRVRPGFYAAMADGILRGPETGAVYCQTQFIDERGIELDRGHMPQAEAGVVADWVEQIYVNLTVQCPCIAVKRSVYERLGGFDPASGSCLDYDMWQRVAAAYPLWFDPRPLAEYRRHRESASRKLFHVTRLWHERKTALERGVLRLSPTIRATTLQAGRHYFTRLAWRELILYWPQFSSRDRLHVVAEFTRMAHGRDVLRMLARRFPRPVPSLPPDPSAGPGGSASPRLLLLTEFFPSDPGVTVFGAFQRLRCHVDALNRVGALDALFLWPENHQLTEEESEPRRQRLRASWPIAGRVRFISTETGPTVEGYRHPLYTLHCVLRGAVSFFNSQLSLRTSGKWMRRRVRDELLRLQPDLIFAHGLGAMAALDRVGTPLPPVIFDLYDLEHVRIRRLAEGLPQRQRMQRIAWGWIARLATRIATRRAHCSLACSAHDADALLRIAPRAAVEVVPNTTADSAELPPASAPTALFVGVAYYPPNAEAILQLVHDIWPRVRRIVPDGELTIVGHGVGQLLNGSAGPGCRVLDFVADLDEVYRGTRIAVCPIRRGSGTRIKIIEAAMRGRPVVSTCVGAEGLTFEPGREILLEDDVQKFAEACAGLLADPARSEALGRAARERAKREYARERVVDSLATIVRRMLPSPRETRRPYVFIGGTSEPGGLHVHTADVARAVAAAGHPVTILCTSVDFFTPMLRGSTVRVVVAQARRPGERAIFYWRRNLSPHRNAVAVLCRGELAASNISDLVGIRLAARKLITIEHRPPDLPWQHAAPPWLHGLVTAATASRCIAVSDEIAASARSLLTIPAARVAVCLNWVEPAFRRATNEERREAKARFGWSPDTMIVGYHGRLAPEKRVDAFLRAIAEAERGPTPWIVALFGEGWKRRELEALAVDLGLRERVHFMGWQPEVSKAVAAIDISVLPSLVEGFPLGLMEAMACGATCLAHPMSSTRALIRSGRNGALADLSDPCAFSKALSDLIALPAEARARLGAEAADTMEREFSRARRLPAVLRALGVEVPDDDRPPVRHLEFVGVPS